MPAVRSVIVREMYDVYKLSQVDISKSMNITQPAVSQYINGERGYLNKLSDDDISFIKTKVKNLFENETENIDKKVCNIFCDICSHILPGKSFFDSH